YVNERIGYQPSPFTVSVEIANNGTTTFPSVQATLSLPSGVTFAPGESATKALPSPLTPGRQGVIAWSCIPSPTETTVTVRFDVRVEIEGLSFVGCSSTSVVERIRRLVVLSIPKGNVVRSGKNIFVTVFYGHTPGALVSAFGFDVLYDPATVRIDGLERAGTLTEHWPSVALAQTANGRVRITGMAGEPLAGSGPLALLNVFAVSGDGSDNRFGWKYSELRLADPAFPEGIDVELQHGDIVTSGDCLVPLAGSERFVIPTARPNPFRETTTVTFRLEPADEEGTVVVDVLDTFGRVVRRLAEGRFTAGEHVAHLEAHELPTGVYFCRLIGNAGVRVGLLVKSR
ncbi:MAG: hypothetical protein QHI48_10825, partial [Bacteroidota bacterium]|nr:hypothetical protein [Bacteroidota bacterium]